jgi:hypothetical protein
VVLAAAIGLAATACGNGDDDARSSSSTSRAAAAPATGGAAPSDAPASAARPRDGSLGDENSKRACELLTQLEIEAQFGGPVGEATPMYPYCQWIVGDDKSAFVAVTIIPMPMSEAREIHAVRSELEEIIGDDAYIASTRAIFFGQGGTSYSILWQKVGDFTTVETAKLSALAHNVLARV